MSIESVRSMMVVGRFPSSSKIGASSSPSSSSPSNSACTISWLGSAIVQLLVHVEPLFILRGPRGLDYLRVELVEQSFALRVSRRAQLARQNFLVVQRVVLAFRAHLRRAQAQALPPFLVILPRNQNAHVLAALLAHRIHPVLRGLGHVRSVGSLLDIFGWVLDRLQPDTLGLVADELRLVCHADERARMVLRRGTLFWCRHHCRSRQTIGRVHTEPA